MSYRFADFELDEERRELRLDDREIPLQPRVFDLLTYLISHRHRVVSKTELLEALWPGTVVVDGALQRVVSLARSALEAGGAKTAIRTHARRGYRFCADLEAAPPEHAEAATSSLLEQAHRSLIAHEWGAARAAFRRADAERALGPQDLERYAQAAQWLGDAIQAIEPLERAVGEHLARDDRRGAARAALTLAQIHLERLELPVAKGWLRRAQHLLTDAAACRELGLAHYAAARFGLMEGTLEEALEHAERVYALGMQLEDADLLGLGLAHRGHALVALGRITAGVDCLDEAAASALAGDMTPWVASATYCSVIWACRNRGDWDRAARWTEQFSRWCERTGLAAFPGTCRLHRAEVLSIRGEITEAEREIAASAELLASWAPWAEGDAYRVLGDLRLAQGELDAAEQAYREAHSRGWDPQPGYALLQVARGRADLSVRALEAALQNRTWALSERRGVLLADLAIAAAAVGDLGRARAALGELENRTDLWSSTAVEPVVLQARAEVALLEGHAAKAAGALREALKRWHSIGSPLHAALTRLRLAEVSIAAGDAATAELELGAAEAVCSRLGARALLARCAGVRTLLDQSDVTSGTPG